MKKPSAILWTVVVLFALGSAALYAQDAALAMSSTKPAVDGVVAPGEYAFQKDFGQMKLFVSRSADTLSIAVVGNTAGWVAAGVGAERMDKATIFMGYAADGATQFKAQVGVSHRHQDAASEVAASVRSYAVKQDGGKTTLEIALDPATYLKANQSVLNLIVAVGSEASFAPRHIARNAIAIKLAP